MLVLTRRSGEEIVIDGMVRVRILAIQGQKLRIGISAPAAISVDRGEVHQQRGEFAVGPTPKARDGKGTEVAPPWATPALAPDIQGD